MILETVVTLTQHDLQREQMNGKHTLIQKLMVKYLCVIFGTHFFTLIVEQLSLPKPIILVIGMFLSSKRCLNELN